MLCASCFCCKHASMGEQHKKKVKFEEWTPPTPNIPEVTSPSKIGPDMNHVPTSTASGQPMVATFQEAMNLYSKKESEWAFGKHASLGDHARFFIIMLVQSFFFYLFGAFITGYNPNPISYCLGFSFLYFAFTACFYSETRGMLTLGHVAVSSLAMNVYWSFALVAVFAILAGSAIAYAAIFGFNNGGGGALFISLGAPTIAPAWINYPAGVFAFEFVASALLFSVFVWAFRLKKVFCFAKAVAHTLAAAEAKGTKTTWAQIEKSMKHQKKNAPGKFAAALIVGLTAGMLKSVGYSIDFAPMDYVAFLWPALFSASFSSTYPGWWIYIVGPAAGVILAIGYWWFRIASTFWSVDTLKKRSKAKLEAKKVEVTQVTTTTTTEKKTV